MLITEIEFEAQSSACRSLLCTTEVQVTSRMIALSWHWTNEKTKRERGAGQSDALLDQARDSSIVAGLDEAVFCRLWLPRMVPIIGWIGRSEEGPLSLTLLK